MGIHYALLFVDSGVVYLSPFRLIQDDFCETVFRDEVQCKTPTMVLSIWDNLLHKAVLFSGTRARMGMGQYHRAHTVHVYCTVM